MSIYEVDRAGVELIAGFEGFINGVYNDSRGLATCGYGHLLHMSRATPADHRTYDGKGREFFLNLLHADIERVSLAPMRNYLTRPLNQNQINAVASACFNCGGGFVAGTVGRKINAGDWRGAADAFYLWSQPPVLRARRTRERALFLQTPTETTPFPWLTVTERRWVLEYDKLKAANKDLPRRRALRNAMHDQAVKIKAAAARSGGWEKSNRRHRYHSLTARSA